MEARRNKHHFTGVVCLSITALLMIGLTRSVFGQCSPDDPDIVCYDLGSIQMGSISMINNAGEVVGYEGYPYFFGGFLWARADGMVDLGDLGGNSCVPSHINDAGQVVGSSRTATGESHAFLWTRGGGMVDLGTLGGNDSWADQINDAGQVMGGSDTTIYGDEHAFFWTQASGMVDLGTFGGTISRAYLFNDAGQVVGWSQTATNDTHTFFWTQAGGMVDLGTLGGSSIRAEQLNNNDQVVGNGRTATGEDHAFFWTQTGGMVDLGTLGGSSATAIQINDAGQVVGGSETATGESHAFLWTQAGGMVDLGTFGGSSSRALDINDAGQVVGWSETATGESHAFLWTQAGGMVDLGTLGGPSSSASEINEAGQVTGGSKTSSLDRRAFLWTQAGGMVDLGTLGGTWSEVVQVNDAGQILGESETAPFTFHPIVWDLPPFLDKTTLYFNGTSDGSFMTSPQTVWVDVKGTTTDPWVVSTDQPWLHVSLAGGAGNGVLTNGSFTVWVDTASSPPPSWDGTVEVSWSGGLDMIRIVKVNGRVFGAGESSPPFGYFDTPVNGATGVTGAVPVTGWALDDIEVTAAQIWRAPVSGEGSSLVYLGDAVFVDGNRPDVEMAFATSPFNYRAGWGFLLLTNYLPNQGNGRFKLYAYASDVEGHQTLLGTKTITCNNANATNPFGTIDTPTQGGPASGMFRNWGWVLTPLPNTVPVDGSTIEVWVDGSPVASGVSVGLARPDIQALFPGYQNTDSAVHYFDLDTTVYENGVHNISWVAVDDAGHSSGIGSRFFRIEN